MAIQIVSRPTVSQPRILLISSPKGGVGKTTIARNLAVAAARSGLDVAAIDLDPQASLSAWWSRRPDDLPMVTLYAAPFPEAIDLSSPTLSRHDLLVMDTPTAIERHPAEIRTLILAADLILVPTGTSLDDTDSVIAWMQMLTGFKARAAFILNRINRRTRAFIDGRARLVAAGSLCPIEIPAYEDIPGTAEAGLGVLEVKGARGAQDIEAVWADVRRELCL